jgi:hypothetical protein
MFTMALWKQILQKKLQLAIFSTQQMLVFCENMLIDKQTSHICGIRHQHSFLKTFRTTFVSAILILYLTTMYVYCVYPAISRGPKELPNFLKIAETCVVLNVFICDVSAYTVTVSFCCSTGIRYQKSYILVSDRI